MEELAFRAQSFRSSNGKGMEEILFILASPGSHWRPSQGDGRDSIQSIYHILLDSIEAQAKRIEKKKVSDPSGQAKGMWRQKTMVMEEIVSRARITSHRRKPGQGDKKDSCWENSEPLWDRAAAGVQESSTPRS